MEDQNTKKINSQQTSFLVQPLGSILGFLYTILIGFGLYFLLRYTQGSGNWLDYNMIVTKAGEGNLLYKFLWMIMNFTEAQFYVGVLASLSIILGGFVAWRLAVKKSRYAGFEVCYGSAKMWPWVLASQVLSVAIAIFVLNFTRFFATGEYDWLPTFITIVGVPPSLMLIYGPSLSTLLTSSILGGILSFPIAFWIMNNIIPVLEVPGVVSNVLTMAITGIIIGQIFKVLPWIKKVPIEKIQSNIQARTPEEELEYMSKPSWFVRRVFADFSEAQFYGNEIAGLFVIIGVSIEWMINGSYLTYAAEVIPAILLSQLIGAGVGVFLYFNKYLKNGWYATYVPVVSTCPACVLMFGGSIPVAVIAGILGGILGGPIAEYLAEKLPEDIHVTVANVSSMAITTIVVSMVIKVLPLI